VIGRFGFNVWQDIIKLQKEQALEAKQKAAAERRAREVKKQEMEQAATVGASVLIGILVVGMVAVVLWAMP